VGTLRRGVTLVELALTMTIIGVAAAVTVPRTAAVVDRLNVRGATQDVLAAFATARATAARRGAYVSFVADPEQGHVRVVSGGTVVLERDLRAMRGVKLAASRESVTFAPSGLGWGAANTTVVVSRGGQTDTIVTSRLGRIRHN
jgi:prepilin-type N-terminal cleavage/methylation domain-containing protein